ncbi:bifunctional histidinol-phosphatase/imidazoleglycerol-phosphate dehydratase HisB [Buchnera aphidicola]|uniref:bifunctional histidinol-phosphatase/imidazoleglycerol-phosphate dehydratase HisB n=1 Tax=Buchnera aphidicola TaxID=9 RepID=UPI0034640D33
MKDKILFIDRDGTLIDEPVSNFQVDNIKKLIFKKHVISSLSKLIQFEYKLVMVTNQDGLGTSTFPIEKFNTPHFFMLDIFYSEGITFDDILICPHFLRDQCECRKPKIKLLQPWLIDNLIDRNRSYVIGDRDTDMELAKNINVMGIQYQEDKCTWTDILKIILTRNRYSEIVRKTQETKIYVQVSLDLPEKSSISTGIKFFDHMLEQLSLHSGIYIKILAKGDLNVDDHHTVEDTGIVLGQALLKALGQKRGLSRFGFCLPMDEAQASCILDISGRPYFKFKSNFLYQMIGDLNTNMIEHFFYSLSYSMNITLHLSSLGRNDHHSAESLFKVFGRALRQAIKIDGDVLPTSKGIL